MQSEFNFKTGFAGDSTPICEVYLWENQLGVEYFLTRAGRLISVLYGRLAAAWLAISVAWSTPAAEIRSGGTSDRPMPEATGEHSR